MLTFSNYDFRYHVTKEEFCVANRPAMQPSLCADADGCYFGDYPTLGELDGHYGDGAAAFWLVPELENLAEFCGGRERLATVSLKECAALIARQYRHLKTSELMLFFYRYKLGCYGHPHGPATPLSVMRALLAFSRERNAAYIRKLSGMRIVEDES